MNNDRLIVALRKYLDVTNGTLNDLLLRAAHQRLGSTAKRGLSDAGLAALNDYLTVDETALTDAMQAAAIQYLNGDDDLGSAIDAALLKYINTPDITTLTLNANASGYVTSDNSQPPGPTRQGRDASTAYRGYVRFPSVTIPKNATITSAILSVEQYAQNGVTPPYIRLVAADNAPALDGISIGGATLQATGSVNTTVGNGPRLYTLTAAVQALVNRAGWASGNSLMVCSELAFDGVSVDFNLWREWNYVTPAERPTLTIEYG